MSSRTLSPSSRRGRQSEARRNDLAVLDAARDVFTSQGAEAPVSAIAARAGVGVGTLYRRYGSKTELLQRICLAAMEQAIAAATDALAIDDPWDAIAGYVRMSVEMRSGALAALAGHVETTDEMQATARRGVKLLDAIVARAHDAGRLRPDVTPVDISWLIELFSRRQPGSTGTAEDHHVRARLLAIALDGLRTPAVEPLPGRPPSRTAYVRRWSPPA